VIFLQFSAAAHTSTVNCNEMDGDRPRQPANKNCYKLPCVSWALLKLLVFINALSVRISRL